MTNSKCPVCGNVYDRKVDTAKEQARIRTNNLGEPDSDKRTKSIGTTGTDVCVAVGRWMSQLTVYLH